MKFDRSACLSAALGSTVTTLWFIGAVMWSVHADAKQRAALVAAERAAELADAMKPDEAARRATEHRATVEARRLACLKDGGSLLKAINGSAEQFDMMVICMLPPGKAASLWAGDVVR